MIELTYRRVMRVKVETGVGTKPLRDQIPPDAVVAAISEDDMASVLFPFVTKTFDSHEEINGMLKARGWGDGNYIEISRKVLASS